MKFGAITFDTQTVETNSFHFDGGLLAQLKQFKSSPTRVIVSEIVVREITKHLYEKTQAAKDAAKTAHKKAVDFGLAESTVPFIKEEIDVRAVVRTRLNKFLQDIGAEYVRASDIPMADLVQAYFRPTPPFVAAGKNKAEFPDAIALMSLELWAKRSSLKILAVSNDKGWGAYCDAHDWIELKSNLADALSLLQQHEDDSRAEIQRLLGAVDAETSPRFEGMLQDALSGYDMFAEGESFYSIEPDQVEIEVVEARFPGEPQKFNFSLVQSEALTLVAEVEVEVSLRAETTFYMSIYDSIDKDYTSAGSTPATTEKDLTFKVLISFERDEDNSPFELSKVEIVSGPRSISFGFVEPDYDPEPEDDYEIPADLPEHVMDENSSF